MSIRRPIEAGQGEMRGSGQVASRDSPSDPFPDFSVPRRIQLRLEERKGISPGSQRTVILSSVRHSGVTSKTETKTP